MKELEILREMVFYVTYDTMGLKSFCFSGPELLALYFGELFFVSLSLSLPYKHKVICIHTNQIIANQIIKSNQIISYQNIKSN